MQPPPRLAAVATAVPRYVLDQEAVVERVKLLFAGAPELARVLPVFASSGIERRYSPVPLDWFAEPHGWAERNAVYTAAAVDLLESAAGRALDRAGIDAGEIGAVVAVSTTGIATPSLDALLIERMGLPPTVRRLPIFGLGCAGGVIGLSHAATMAAAMPDQAVLLLVVELCSLSFRRDDRAKSSIVAAALFGDGAAAAVLHCAAAGPALIAGGEHTWRGSLGIMGWNVAADGLQPVFSRDIPRLVADGLAPVAGTFLARQGLRLAEIDRFVCHPGGPKVIEAIERAYGLPAGALAGERAALREYGNMSAPSVLFVLERALAAGGWQRALLTALGPGFTAGFAVLEAR